MQMWLNPGDPAEIRPEMSRDICVLHHVLQPLNTTTEHDGPNPLECCTTSALLRPQPLLLLSLKDSKYVQPLLKRCFLMPPVVFPCPLPSLHRASTIRGCSRQSHSPSAWSDGMQCHAGANSCGEGSRAAAQLRLLPPGCQPRKHPPQAEPARLDPHRLGPHRKDWCDMHWVLGCLLLQTQAAAVIR